MRPSESTLPAVAFALALAVLVLFNALVGVLK
jgi:hypothetical protein